MKKRSANPATYDEAPMFCCCEFIDRHGKRSHLSDAGVLDTYCNDEFPSCATLLADLDDRIRLPQYNGAVHVGFDGCLPALLLPTLCMVAATGPFHSMLVATAALPLLLAIHKRTIRQRHRAHFFVAWTACTYVYGNLAFTILVGPHISFGLWLLPTVLHVAAATCASATRAVPPSHDVHADGEGDGDDSGGGGDEESGGSDDAETARLQQPSRDGAPPQELPERLRAQGYVRCPFSGQVVARYDHYCIWLNACIGAHNMGSFIRGLWTLLGAVAVQGAICAQRALHSGRSWGTLFVLALYALVICLGLVALLVSLWLNRARGLTAYEVRMRVRKGEPLPPIRAAALVSELGGCGCA